MVAGGLGVVSIAAAAYLLLERLGRPPRA
jgi:hypothetical protein